MSRKRTKQHFSILSSVKCKDCDKPLKVNVVDRKKNPIRCYKCHVEHEAVDGHFMMGKKGLIPKPTFKRNLHN